MSNPAAMAASNNAAAARHQMMVNAIRACGPIVNIDPDGFVEIINRSRGEESNPLIVHSEGGWFSTNYYYLTSYKGLFFWTKSPILMDFPMGVEMIRVKKIWLPNL